MELLLLGCFALVQSRVVSSAGVHQTAVAVVLMRLYPSNVQLSISAIITVLHQRTVIIHRQNITDSICSDSVNIPVMIGNGRYMQWVCFQELGLGRYRVLASGR